MLAGAEEEEGDYLDDEFDDDDLDDELIDALELIAGAPTRPCLKCGSGMREATPEEVPEGVPEDAHNPAVCPECGNFSVMIGAPQAFGDWA